MPHPFQLPDIGYPHDALEPHIDARTMEIHHGKHHAAYTANLNSAVEGHPHLYGKTAHELISDLGSLPEEIRGAVRNNGGGYVNHAFFWKLMARGGADAPSGGLARAIDGSFGGVEEFKARFAAAAMARFGSGWAWLVAGQDGGLEVTSTPNQDTPVMEGRAPILGLDVWEHAYYLRYQNRRPDYVAAFWHVLNWTVVEENLRAV